MPQEAEAVLTPTATETWLHERFGKVDLRRLIRAVSASKRTGSMTLHFSQGKVAAVEWRQRAPEMHERESGSVRQTVIERETAEMF